MNKTDCEDLLLIQHEAFVNRIEGNHRLMGMEVRQLDILSFETDRVVIQVRDGKNMWQFYSRKGGVGNLGGALGGGWWERHSWGGVNEWSGRLLL